MAGWMNEEQEKEYWEKERLAKIERQKPKSSWQTGEWDFSSLDVDINKIVWKCIRRLNKEGSRSGEFHWIPVKLVRLENFGNYGRTYCIQVVLAESSIKKKEIGARDFGPGQNLQMREGAQRRIYEIRAGISPRTSPEIKIFNKIRDLNPDEILPDGYENIVPGDIFGHGPVG